MDITFHSSVLRSDDSFFFPLFFMLNEKLLTFVTGKETASVLVSDNQLVFSFG